MDTKRGQSVGEPGVSPALLIGVSAIDAEHRALFGQLDRLIGKPQAHPIAESFSEILSQLGRQIDDHFLNEERFLRDCGMPDEEVAEHVSAHEEILEQYTRLNLDLMAGKQIGQDSILQLIRGWIVDHVIRHDTRIRRHIAAP